VIKENNIVMSGNGIQNSGTNMMGRRIADQNNNINQISGPQSSGGQGFNQN